MREMVKRIPFAGPFLRKLYRAWRTRLIPFPGSESYWIGRYSSGGNSGPGSYDQLAEFKAQILNDFVEENCVTTIIEYGCGDGNQLRLARYPSYIGFDVSPTAIALCAEIFRNDGTKSFKLTTEYRAETAKLTLSLDVIFHLVEDDIYYSYMRRLFASSERFVIVYSSNFDSEQDYHEKHRKFTSWVESNEPLWKLIRHIPNRFPYNAQTERGSLCDFYMYEKTQG